MNIKDLYIESLKDHFKRLSFLSNAIPGRIAFNKSFKQKIESSPFLGSTSLIGSLTEFDNPKAQFNEQNIRQMLDHFYLDSLVIKKALHKAEIEIKETWSEWSSFYKTTLPVLRELENKSIRLLLLEEESKGYLEFFKEEFLSLDYIDTENSDVTINTEQGFVYIEENELGSRKKKIEGNVLSVNIGGSNQIGEVTITTIPGSSVNNLVSNSTQGWIGQVYSTSAQPCTCEVTFHLDGSKEIQEIKLDPLYVEHKEGLVSMAYSINGVDWIDSSTQHALSDPWIWLIERSKVKKIKFFITKENYDVTGHNGDYYYLFNIKNLSTYKESTQLFRKDNAVLISEVLDVGNFRKVSIEACTINTNETSVDFYISVADDWVAINPLNAPPNEKPKVVSFDSVKTQNNLDPDSSFFIDSSKPSTSLLNPQDTPDDLFEEFNRQGIFVLNFQIPESQINSTQLNEISLLGDYTTQVSLENIKGWSVGNKLSTYVYVDTQEPLVFNLNEGSILINKQEKFGNIVIPSNQLTLLECNLNQYSFTEFNAVNESQLSNLDILYPNNLKHLIEGYPYQSSFTGRRIYQGSSYRAARKYKPAEDFNSFIETVGSYYLSYNRDSSSYYVFVNTSMNLEELSNQKYFIEYNFSPTVFDSIRLKAELKTRNMTISPIVTNYTIKLGY